MGPRGKKKRVKKENGDSSPTKVDICRKKNFPGNKMLQREQSVSSTIGKNIQNYANFSVYVCTNDCIKY